MLNTGVQVSCIPYDCYREFNLKTKIDKNVRATVHSANGSNLGPIGTATCSLLLGVHEIEHNFIVCKHLFHPIILDFAQDFKAGIDWNHQGHLYLHQDQNPLTYSKPSSSKYTTIFSVKCDEVTLISGTNILYSPKQ